MEHKTKDVITALGEKLNLSSEDLNAIIPSGQKTIANRVGWATTFLVKAELLKRPARGLIEITDLGKEYLIKNVKITVKLLKENPNFEKNVEKRRVNQILRDKPK